MILIVGGAYQGKAAFAESLFPKIRWMDGETCDFADLYECQGILRFHAYIRRMLEKGQDVEFYFSCMNLLKKGSSALFQMRLIPLWAAAEMLRNLQMRQDRRLPAN